ncbi:GIP [Symbiodinium natans]|uniref:GIP protein n=1 Tax=Symbiodinium natans TaxID=878477 RepID=A0A812P436_9DINO|nr:GIP [Symbiodinium natans]
MAAPSAKEEAFAGAAEERDPVVEHPDPEISAAINEEEYLVTPVKGCDFAFEIGNFPILRSKRMELLPGDFTFPMRSEQLALQESLRKPTLADQDCSWGDTEGAGTRAPPGDSPDEPLPPPGVPDLDGSDLKDRLSEYLDQVAKENEDYVPEDVGAVEDWLGRDAPGSSKAQREADIERFERKKAREAEEDARKALRDSPAMPVIAEPDPAHFGKIFEICSVKGDELPDGHPQKKWKGRSVFQGNNVQDENHDHAIFAELGSSPASMEAGKIIDVFGSQPGYVKQQADGIAAYTQALFKGIETWVRLPRNRWPKEWSGYEDPVCPLRLALYGHPDSGGIWERYCTEQLESVGFTAVLPDIWHSVFYHAELDLLLVVYVDDFKMAGPQDKINKGWELIAKVIDMEPAEVLGRYFGCHHVEQNQVQLSREDHPFAYVFDKKHASPAADYQVRPNRKEDFWEVDAELAAVVRLVDWENIFPHH